MNHSELRQHFYRELSPLYLQGELQALYHWCAQELMGWSRAEAYLHNAEVVEHTLLQRWNQVIERLKQHEPIQYIFGKAWFHNLVLRVDRNVLIPRPETEELVQLVLDSQLSASGLRIADVGTGSGCIALALKKERPHWAVSGCDVSPEALAVASSNARDNRLAVDFFLLDLHSDEFLTARFDVVVSNPPYIPTDLKHTLAANVIGHEPHLALFAPAGDPFYFFRRITALALAWEAKAVFFETHATEVESLVAALEPLWPGLITTHPDMQGKMRFLQMVRI